MVAFAIPIKANSRDLQAAIWAVGLTRQVPNSSIQELIEYLPENVDIPPSLFYVCVIVPNRPKNNYFVMHFSIDNFFLIIYKYIAAK